MVRFASLFDVKEQTVTFMSRTKYSLEELWGMGMGDLLGSMFEFSEKLSALDLTDEELGLFTAVVLVSAGGSRGDAEPGAPGRRRGACPPACPPADAPSPQTARAWRTRHRWSSCRRR